MKSAKEWLRLERIAETADALERWMGKNVGDNADWPVSIKADQESANKLCSLLQDLHDALMPYRRPGNLTLTAPLNPEEEVNHDEEEP